MLPRLIVCPVQVGFWKDLLQLLQRLCVGEDDWNEAARQKSLQKLRKGANREERRVGKLQRLRERKASLISFAQGAHLEPEPAPAQRPEQPAGEWRSARTRKARYGAAGPRRLRRGQLPRCLSLSGCQGCALLVACPA